MEELFMYSFWILCITSLLVLKIVNELWWRPKHVELHYSKQGITGPPYRFIVGNVMELASLMIKPSSQPTPRSHDILPRVFSFYRHWSKIYGANFLLWIGPTPCLTVTDPDLIREVLVSKAEYYEKIVSHPFVRQLGGDGLLNTNGEKWANHRKILQPTFHMENLKLLMPVMGRCVLEMLDKWSIRSGSDGYEIEVSDFFQTLTEEIITRTVFRSSTYTDAKPIFQLQAEQMILAAESFQTVYIPGYRFVPTKKNRSYWRLNKERTKSIVRFIERGKETYNSKIHNNDGSPKDLLGLMFREAVQESSPLRKITDHDIVEECKSFFFAGKETTSNLLTWTTILLAMHPEWQDLAREEILKVCGSNEISTIDDIAKLKTLSMIISESLRLYPPVVAVIRRAKTNVQLGDYKILCGSELLIPIICGHHNPELWGNDAAEFNPARFTKGVSHAAKHPMGYIPFGNGGQICIGQNLAILQAKLTIAIILQRYSFRLSPNYQHVPTVLLLLCPLHGAPITFRRLEDIKINLDKGSGSITKDIPH